MKRKKFTWYGKETDSDYDGVPNYRDCMPFNPKRQHLSKTMERRIEKLPIYTSPLSIRGEQDEVWENMKDKIDKDNPDIQGEVMSHYYSRPLPHILSKEAKNTDARELFLSAVSKYPGVVSEIERTEPRKVVITSQRQSDRYMPSGWVSPQQEVFVGPQTPYKSKTQRKKFTKAMYHELKHVQQLKEQSYKDIIKQYPYVRSDEGEKISKGGLTAVEYDDIAKQYSEVPVEKEAIKFSKERMEEYHKGRTPLLKNFFNIIKEEGDY